MLHRSAMTAVILTRSSGLALAAVESAPPAPNTDTSDPHPAITTEAHQEEQG